MLGVTVASTGVDGSVAVTSGFVVGSVVVVVAADVGVRVAAVVGVANGAGEGVIVSTGLAAGGVSVSVGDLTLWVGSETGLFSRGSGDAGLVAQPRRSMRIRMTASAIVTSNLNKS